MDSKVIVRFILSCRFTIHLRGQQQRRALWAGAAVGRLILIICTSTNQGAAADVNGSHFRFNGGATADLCASRDIQCAFHRPINTRHIRIRGQCAATDGGSCPRRMQVVASNGEVSHIDRPTGHFKFSALVFIRVSVAVITIGCIDGVKQGNAKSSITSHFCTRYCDFPTKRIDETFIGIHNQSFIQHYGTEIVLHTTITEGSAVLNRQCAIIRIL